MHLHGGNDHERLVFTDLLQERVVMRGNGINNVLKICTSVYWFLNEEENAFVFIEQITIIENLIHLSATNCLFVGQSLK